MVNIAIVSKPWRFSFEGRALSMAARVPAGVLRPFMWAVVAVWRRPMSRAWWGLLWHMAARIDTSGLLLDVIEDKARIWARRTDCPCESCSGGAL